MNALQDTRVILASINNTAATTPRTALIDCVNGNSLKVLATVLKNTNSDKNVTIALTSGDDGTSTAAYTSIGSSAGAANIDAAHVCDVDLRGKGRYVYLTLTPGTAGTTDAVSVLSVIGVLETSLRPQNSTTQVGNGVFA